MIESMFSILYDSTDGGVRARLGEWRNVFTGEKLHWPWVGLLINVFICVLGIIE